MVIKNVIVVLSGKGGVGKSSVSLQLALSAYHRDGQSRVGVLDVDLCGPSIPRMFHLQDQKVMQSSSGWVPVYADAERRLGVMSIGFLLPSSDSAVVWRGPKKNSMIAQFITNVAWGDLDYLIIDTPPGTSDEHLALVEALASHENVRAVIVTTPQLVAISDVEKEISFCKTVGFPIAGVIENMSGYVCQHCAHCTNIFSSGGGEQLAQKHELRFLGRVPICPAFIRLCERTDTNIVTDYTSCDLYTTFDSIFTSLTE